MTEAPVGHPRKIVHCDCDSFFASVEIRDNPKLAGQPVAVGGDPDARGVVATCNYEARKYGIHSAMPMSQARRLCPALVMLRTNMERYRTVSGQVREIFERYTAIIEPVSLDEAFLDVTNTKACQGSGTLIAEAIRRAVRSEIGITISAGIAPNKFLAKIASDWNKPDGQLTIAPGDVAAFVASLPVEKMHGVGEATAAKLHARGIQTCQDLRAVDLAELIGSFGKFGARLYHLARGEDDRPVKMNRVRKSVSVEHTYARDIRTVDIGMAELNTLIAKLEERIARVDVSSRTSGCFVKVRFEGFETTTASCAGGQVKLETFERLLKQAWQRGDRPVRLIGVGVKLKEPAAENQIDLFGEHAP